MGFIFAAHPPPPTDSASSCSESSCVGDLVEGREFAFENTCWLA